MDKKPLISKWLTIGIILPIIITSMILPIINATSVDNYGMSIPEKNKSSVQENITVTFTFPENEIYWNNHTIASCSVPVILHYYFNKTIPVRFKIEPEENISMIKFYINGVYAITYIGGPPLLDVWLLKLSRFSSVNFKIVAYSYQGEQVSNDITIWRLFL